MAKQPARTTSESATSGHVRRNLSEGGERKAQVPHPSTPRHGHHTKIVSVFTVISLFSLVTGVMLMVSAVNQEQDIRQRAAELEAAKKNAVRNIPRERYVPGELIVKYKQDTALSAASVNAAESRFRNRHNAHAARRMNRLRQTKLLVPKGQEDKTLQELRKDPSVEYVERNAYVYPLAEVDDPKFGDQWYLERVGVPEAWDVTDGQGIKIAVIDSGIDTSHPEFQGRIAGGVDIKTGAKIYNDETENSHGTAVAGIIAANANNDEGIAGVCPKCQLLIVKVHGAENGSDTLTISEGIKWAVDNGAHVINISMFSPTESEVLGDAISDAWEKNILVVAGAGNCGASNYAEWACSTQNQPGYPAAFDNVVAVGAIDSKDKRIAVSNHGDYVDLAAPGLSMYTTTRGKGYAYADGTSFSAPVVSGVAGLIISANKGIKVDKVVDILKNTAEEINGTGTDWQFGLVNAAAAVGADTGESENTGEDEANDDSGDETTDEEESDTSENSDGTTEENTDEETTDDTNTGSPNDDSGTPTNDSGGGSTTSSPSEENKPDTNTGDLDEGFCIGSCVTPEAPGTTDDGTTAQRQGPETPGFAEALRQRITEMQSNFSSFFSTFREDMAGLGDRIRQNIADAFNRNPSTTTEDPDEPFSPRTPATPRPPRRPSISVPGNNQDNDRPTNSNREFYDSIRNDAESRVPTRAPK